MGGSQSWIPSALCAAVFFSIANEFISVLTAHMDGFSCVFYMSFGGWVAGIVYQLIMSCINWRDPNVNYVWHRNNIIVDEKVNRIHLILFMLSCCLFFLITISKLMTIYFSNMSGVNVGVITTMWSIEPLFGALLDRIINGQKLSINHAIGIILIVSGAISIGYAGIYKK